MIAIVDYGMGNLRSVEKALQRAGEAAVRTDDHDRIAAADGIVLPGVGAFPSAMERIRERRLDAVIAERADAGTPLLGICLGLQLLFESSPERDGDSGLGLIEGAVARIQAGGRKVPHIGWAPVSWERPSELTAGLAEAEPFYFVHSLAPRPAQVTDVLGTARYGERFTCAVERGSVFGVQFHPEKSSGAGLRLLRNFGRICARARAGIGSGPVGP